MHPTLFRIGPVEIYSYGVMLMIGFIAAILWARREARKKGIPPDNILDLSLWILIFSIIFARLTYILLNWDYYAGESLTSFFMVGGRVAIQGLSFHGGLIGALLGGLIYAKRSKISWLTLGDITAPAVALGYGFGRIGCFLNGCCYGAPTDAPWATRFVIDPAISTWTDPSHPTQIYAALGSWMIFGLLIVLRGKMQGKGQLFFTYTALYSIMRFLIEFLRKGYSAVEFLPPLTEAQVASILIFILSIVLIFVLRPARLSDKAAKA